MSTAELEKINRLMGKAQQFLQENQQGMEKILHESQNEDTSFEELAHSLQLVLQYRLNCQDALVALLNLDHHLLYGLGIQAQHSTTNNLERLSYALGSDDLKQILHALSQLVESLLKIARRHQRTIEHHPTTLEKQSVKNSSPNKFIKNIKKLILRQEHFLLLINQLDSSIKQLVKLEAIGPVRDHIAALRGPVSQFHQAMLHGLAQVQLLYQKIHKTPILDHNLSQLLKKTEQVLDLMPSLYQPSPNCSLGHFAAKSSEDLEQRAAAKRLRPFFG